MNGQAGLGSTFRLSDWDGEFRELSVRRSWINFVWQGRRVGGRARVLPSPSEDLVKELDQSERDSSHQSASLTR